MSDARPIESIWDGSVFRPINPHWQRVADKEFARGEVLHLTDQGERSSKSHRFYFAAVDEAWKNLPPLMADRFPSPDHLRYFALIKAGFCNSHSLPCGTAVAARRTAAFIRPLDEYSLVTVEGSVVHVFKAESQSFKSMGKERFRRSKDGVLRVIAEMIEVTKQELIDNAGRAA